MRISQNGAVASLTALALLLGASPAAAVQNWFGYGGTFGTQTYYTYYAPQPVVANYAPAPVATYMVPAAQPVAAPVITSRVVVPAVAYAPVVAYRPVTAFAPVTSCRPVVSYYGATCGSTCGSTCLPYRVPAATTIPVVPAPVVVAPPVTVTPAPTTTFPATPAPYTVPNYPPPGVYPQAPVYPTAPTRTPELPNSGISPADRAPTLSGRVPLDAGAALPAAPPAAATTTEKTKADPYQPDLNVSVGEGDDLVPVEESAKEKSEEKAPAEPAADAESTSGPVLKLDEDNTASLQKNRTNLLAPATWRAHRPPRRAAHSAPELIWRAATK